MLIVATGARLMPEETPGMLGPGWLSDVFTFYSLEGAQALEQKLAKFDAGRLVVNVVDMPIKCPVAPLEFCFLADWFFRQHGKRERVEITYVTPLGCSRGSTGTSCSRAVTSRESNPPCRRAARIAR